MKIITKASYREGILKDYDFEFSDNHNKKYRYGCESYFQEAFSGFKAANVDLAEARQTTSYMLLKPDFFVGGQLPLLYDVLEQLDCNVIGAFDFQLNRYSIRELWRYEYNTATMDRYPLIDALLTSGSSVLLLLQKRGADRSQADFCHYITQLKKSNSNPELLAGKSIRQHLRVKSGTLNFIHTPDEFIDLVRELGVLFEGADRAQIADAIITGNAVDYQRVLQSVAAQYPKLSLDGMNDPDQDGISKDLVAHWNQVIELNNTAVFKDPDVIRLFDFEEVYCERT